MTTAAQVLQVAQAQVGVLSDAHNDTKYSDWFQANYPKDGVDYRGLNWCAMFVSWVLHQAGYGLQTPWAPDLTNAFRAFGVFDLLPRPGDVVVYHWEGGAEPTGDHTGLVEAVLYDGSVLTIEGNAGTPVGVHRHLIGPNGDRSFAEVVGYGHPFYSL